MLQKNKFLQLLCYRKIYALLVLLTADWIPLSAQDKSGYREILSYMKQHSPALMLSAARIREARHLEQGETIWAENPLLGFGIMNTPLAAFPATDREAMSGYTVTLKQKLFLPWQTAARRQQASSRYLLAREEHLANEQQLVLQVLSRYNKIYFASERDHLLIQTHQTLTQMRRLAVVNSALPSGNSIWLQRLSAETELHLNEIRENLAEREALLTELQGILGVKPQVADFTSDLKKTLLEHPVPEMELNRLPWLRAAQHAEQAAAAFVSQSKSEVLGDIMLGAGYLARRPTAMSRGEDLVSLEISFPLPLTYPWRDTELIAASQAAHEQARLRIEQLRRDQESAYQAELRREQSLFQSLQNIRGTVLPLLQAAYKNQLARLATGKAEFMEVLQLYREIKDARLRELNTVQELCEIRLRLYYLAGKIQEL